MNHSLITHDNHEIEEVYKNYINLLPKDGYLNNMRRFKRFDIKIYRGGYSYNIFNEMLNELKHKKTTYRQIRSWYL